MIRLKSLSLAAFFFDSLSFDLAHVNRCQFTNKTVLNTLIISVCSCSDWLQADRFISNHFITFACWLYDQEPVLTSLVGARAKEMTSLLFDSLQLTLAYSSLTIRSSILPIATSIGAFLFNTIVFSLRLKLFTTSFSCIMKPVLDSINQLISVIAGRAIAQQTVHLKTKPSKRCSEAIRIASEVEMKQGLEDLNEMNDDRKYKQVQRKLESLSSIQRLALFFEKHQND